MDNIDPNIKMTLKSQECEYIVRVRVVKYMYIYISPLPMCHGAIVSRGRLSYP